MAVQPRLGAEVDFSRRGGPGHRIDGSVRRSEAVKCCIVSDPIARTAARDGLTGLNWRCRSLIRHISNVGRRVTSRHRGSRLAPMSDPSAKALMLPCWTVGKSPCAESYPTPALSTRRRRNSLGRTYISQTAFAGYQDVRGVHVERVVLDRVDVVDGCSWLCDISWHVCGSTFRYTASMAMYGSFDVYGRTCNNGVQ